MGHVIAIGKATLVVWGIVVVGLTLGGIIVNIVRAVVKRIF